MGGGAARQARASNVLSQTSRGSAKTVSDEAHDDFSPWARWVSSRTRCRADLFELGVQSLPDGRLHEQPFGLQLALSDRAISGTLSEAIVATNSRHGTRHTGPPSNCLVPCRQRVSQSHDACYFPHRRWRRRGTPSSYDSRLCVFASNSLAGCPLAARPRIYREIWRRRRGAHLLELEHRDKSAECAQQSGSGGCVLFLEARFVRGGSAERSSKALAPEPKEPTDAAPAPEELLAGACVRLEEKKHQQAHSRMALPVVWEKSCLAAETDCRHGCVSLLEERSWSTVDAALDIATDGRSRLARLQTHHLPLRTYRANLRTFTSQCSVLSVGSLAVPIHCTSCCDLDLTFFHTTSVCQWLN